MVPGHHVTTEDGELHYELTMSYANTDDEFAVTDVIGELGLQTNTYVLTLPIYNSSSVPLPRQRSESDFVLRRSTRQANESTGYCIQSRDFDLTAHGCRLPTSRQSWLNKIAPSWKASCHTRSHLSPRRSCSSLSTEWPWPADGPCERSVKGS